MRTHAVFVDVEALWSKVEFGDAARGLRSEKERSYLAAYDARASDAARVTSTAADSVGSSRRPVPTPWKRNRLCGISACSSLGTVFEIEAPTPVVTP